MLEWWYHPRPHTRRSLFPSILIQPGSVSCLNVQETVLFIQARVLSMNPSVFISVKAVIGSKPLSTAKKENWCKIKDNLSICWQVYLVAGARQVKKTESDCSNKGIYFVHGRLSQHVFQNLIKWIIHAEMVEESIIIWHRLSVSVSLCFTTLNSWNVTKRRWSEVIFCNEGKKTMLVVENRKRLFDKGLDDRKD